MNEIKAVGSDPRLSIQSLCSEMIIQKYLSIIQAGITAVCAQGREYQEEDREEGLHCREDQYRLWDTVLPTPYQCLCTLYTVHRHRIRLC